jgi:hypothetical protein
VVLGVVELHDLAGDGRFERAVVVWIVGSDQLCFYCAIRGMIA